MLHHIVDFRKSYSSKGFLISDLEHIDWILDVRLHGLYADFSWWLFSSDILDTYCERYIGLRHEYIGFLITNAPSQSLIKKLLNDWEPSNVVYINIARVS